MEFAKIFEEEKSQALNSFQPATSSMNKNRKWTSAEDALLKQNVQLYGENKWRRISQNMQDRSSIQCLNRWTKLKNLALAKGQEIPKQISEGTKQMATMKRLLSSTGNRKPLMEEAKVKFVDGESEKDFENFLASRNFDSSNSSPTTYCDEIEQEVDISSGLKNIQNAILTYSHQAKNPIEVSPCKLNSAIPLNISNAKPIDMKMVSSKILFPVAQKPVSEGFVSKSSSQNILNPIARRLGSENNMLDNPLSLPQRIVDECLAKRLNEGERVDNLIKLLPKQNLFNTEDTQNASVQEGLSKATKKLVLEKLRQAINCLSVVHSNYVQYVISIARELPQGNPIEMNLKMEYLYHQLSMLKTLVMNVKNKIVSLETTFRSLNNQKRTLFDEIKIEETETAASNVQQQNDKNVMLINIKNLNSGFEGISKKRIVG